MSRLAIFALCSLALGACRNKEAVAPFAPAGSGPMYVGATTKDAAPSASDDEDGGGKVDSGKPSVNECDNVDAVNGVIDTSTENIVNSITSPTDFAVTRVKTTWEPGCARPTIRLELSDGRCPNGSGHALVFDFDAKAIEDGSIRLGLNTIVPVVTTDIVDNIVIRYSRPRGLSPTGTFGTCEGAAGTLDLLGELKPNSIGKLQGRFDLELTDCAGTNKTLQRVTGTFSGTLRRTLQTVCPTTLP